MNEHSKPAASTDSANPAWVLLVVFVALGAFACGAWFGRDSAPATCSPAQCKALEVEAKDAKKWVADMARRMALVETWLDRSEAKLAAWESFRSTYEKFQAEYAAYLAAQGCKCGCQQAPCQCAGGCCK